ncbi:MAG: sulfotransferase [Pirellulales bacterium]
MPVTFEFDRPTAIKVAEFLESSGMAKEAADVWLNLSAEDPYDRHVRERFGNLLFEISQAAYRPGTIERSQFILRVIGHSWPTPILRQAYFDNLQMVLRGKNRRGQSGAVVLGLGAGRCGSATLTAAFAALPEACATHEIPPLVFWEPAAEQLQFHWDRFRLLSEYFAVVFDTAPPWINAASAFLREFPQGKVVGLYRDTAANVQSYLSIQGSGGEASNLWAPRGSHLWRTTPADPSYPSYAVPARLLNDLNAARAEAIERFVTEYNQMLKSLAAAHTGRLLLVRTEEMNTDETARQLQDFLGVPLVMPAALNVGGTTDSRKLKQSRAF